MKSWGLFSGFTSLQFSSGLQVSEELDHMGGEGWGSGQVVTLGLETVLIGNPGDGVGHSFFGVREFALGDGSRVFGFGAELFLDSALADDDTVLTLETAIVDKCLIIESIGGQCGPHREE